jgi:hypothetical protein
MNNSTAAAADFLNGLEARESRLLAWGLVDGSFDEDELADLAEDFLNERKLWSEFPEPVDLVDYLLDRRLLFSFVDGTRSRYRTRMGETIRLLARLRQLFPQHRDGRQWQQAKTLVADFRFILRSRQFPRRNVSRVDAETSINEVCRLDPLQKDVLAAILDRGAGRPMELAEFQVRSTRSILANIGVRQATGSIVCAGTGSGKTLSFYLPAFLHIVPTLDQSRWTRCLAIYPRKELLKDQLSETYRQARRIDHVLKTHRRRRLAIGTLFGDTPKNGRWFNYDSPPAGWRKLGSGFACPFLRCPDEKCHGEMVWKDADRNVDVERLICHACGTATAPDELILTRDRLLSEPPDILFTTTEMLNQRLGDSQFGRLFGVGTPPTQKPPLVLLDEVHTYSGVSGAQVALLLRRWKHAARTWPHFVGLSATLTDARRFFARLIGVDEFRVEEVSPHPNDMTHSGAEYLIAVRGDPASGASLLSTTIQTAMLMRRVQDASDRPCSEGLYGTREFVFTDDLDVTNRLYFNLLDAEGLILDKRGNLQPNPKKPGGSLANLRSSDLPEQGLRQRFGQSWRLCEDIGHSLRNNTSLRIGRTSSQDAGVATGADVIVATASLEVGFNDPEVNVVLQHKSPRDPAQFLQRKGRAGRRTEMRPWTVVVLSDYGRDRLTWQSYDLLFDPELPPRDLPVGNRYVLRMQAVFAFMDWVADQLRRQPGIPRGRVWQDFALPPDEVSSSNQASVRRRQQAAAAIVEDLLVRNDRHEALSQYLQRSLAQDESVISAVMWEPPRALMTAVLPTLLRRLKSGWKRSSQGGESGRQSYDYFVSNNPLPEFVPGQLFSDLNLPEVSIVTAQERNAKPREESLPILQAMKEFAPGRISHRFGILNQWARHWIALPDLHPAPVKYLPLSNYLTCCDELGDFQYRCPETHTVKVVRCVRPYELQPQQPPEQVQDTSNAFLIWQTQIVRSSEGISVDVPSPSRWETLIRNIEFFTHRHHSPLEIRRFSMASEANVKLLNGTEIETRVEFVDAIPDASSPETTKPDPVAVGFAADVDGVVFRFSMPDDFGVQGSDPALVRGLRTTLFRDRVIVDSTLDGIANCFRRQWLSEVYVAALVESAFSSGQTLADIWQARTESDFDEVLQIIFQSIPVSTDGGHGGDYDGDDAPLDEVHQKLFTDLSALLHNAAVVDVLRIHAPTLWQEPDAGWSEWLDRKFRTTLGAAILNGIQQLCPDMDAGDLTLDIDPGPRPPESIASDDGLSEVWLTERTVGGGGIIENFLARYGEDPRRFFDLVEAALKPSDFEIADEQLTLFLDWVMSDSEAAVRDAVGVVRKAMNDRHEEFASAFQNLIRLLSSRGLFVCHSVVAAIATRILKPGSNPQTDQMLHQLIHEWQAREEQLGIEIDSRVFASQCARDGSLDTSLGKLQGDALETDRRQWRFSALMSVLWPRGSVIRSRRLSVYNPFAKLPSTEHDLVRNCLPSDIEVVDVAAIGWRERANESLVRDSAVELRAPAAESRSLRSAILSMIVDPVDSGFMLLHPRVRSMERGTGFVSVTLDLAEAGQ